MISLQNEMIRNAIFGAIVGDAIGVPYEFKSREQMQRRPCRGLVGYGTHHQPAGTWSDDGALILAQMDSISSTGKINFSDQARNFIEWRSKGEFTAGGNVFDIGGTTSKAISNMRRLKDVTAAGPKDVNSCGNGSLMRILPAALFLANDPRPIRHKLIAKCSSMTHGHPRCLLACQLYSDIISTMLRSSRWVDYGWLCAAEMKEHYSSIYDEETISEFDRIWNRDLSNPRGSGYVVDCLHAALVCAVKAENYLEGVYSAVNLGEDTDTTACVTGGLLGLQFYGAKSVPVSMKRALRRQMTVEGNVVDFKRTCLQHWAEVC